MEETTTLCEGKPISKLNLLDAFVISQELSKELEEGRGTEQFCIKLTPKSYAVLYMALEDFRKETARVLKK